jgi:hypothetical protein
MRLQLRNQARRIKAALLEQFCGRGSPNEIAWLGERFAYLA